MLRTLPMNAQSTGPSRINWALIFLVVGGIIGTAFVFTTPSLAGTDEPQHLTRVALIDRGWFIPPATSRGAVRPADYRLDGCFDAELVDRLLATLSDRPLDWSAQFHNARCGPASSDHVGLAVTANVYSAVPYLPALVGFRIGRLFGGAAGSIYLARLFQMAAYLALCWYAIRRAPWGKPLFFTLALLPVVLQSASGISADPVTNGLAFCTVALILAAIDRSRTGRVTRLDTVILGLVIAALALSKSAYVPFALLTLAIPTAAFGSHRRRMVVTGSIIGSAVILAGAWNIGVVSHVHIIGINHSDSVAAADWIRRHPWDFIKSIKRGWTVPVEYQAVLHGVFIPFKRFHQNPAVPLIPLFAWLLLARLADPAPGLRRPRPEVEDRPGSISPSPESTPNTSALTLRDRVWGVSLALAVTVSAFLLIEYGLALSANPPAAYRIVWVQGRYFIPLIPLTLFGFSGQHRRVVPDRVMIVLPVISTLFASWWLWYAAHEAYGWL